MIISNCICVPANGIILFFFVAEQYSTVCFPSGSDSKRICLQWRRPGFDPWIRKIPWKKKWQPTPVSPAWRIPWTEEPRRLQPMESQRVRDNWAINTRQQQYSIASMYQKDVAFVIRLQNIPASVLLADSLYWLWQNKLPYWGGAEGGLCPKIRNWGP